MRRFTCLAAAIAATGLVVLVGPEALAACEQFGGGQVSMFTLPANVSVKADPTAVKFSVDGFGPGAKACGEAHTSGNPTGHLWVDGEGAAVTWTPLDGYVAVGNDGRGDPEGNNNGQARTACVATQGTPSEGADDPATRPTAPSGVPKVICPI